MLILDLWGIGFHAVVVFGMGKDFLFKSVLGHCDTKYFDTFWIEKNGGNIVKCYIEIGKLVLDFYFCYLNSKRLTALNFKDFN